MTKTEKLAATAEEFVALTKDASIQRIVVRGDLVKVPTVRLAPGQLLRGEGEHAREIDIAGGVKTNGAGVSPIEQHGAVDALRVAGGFVATGGGFDKI